MFKQVIDACNGTELGVRRPVIIYHGIYCDTGKSKLDLPSVTCRLRCGNGYTTVMARQRLMLLHNGDVRWLKRNR